MQIVDPGFVKGKKVILRLDIDVPLEKGTGDGGPIPKVGRVTEDFKLRAGLPTLKLCLEHANEVIIIGHIGRPEGKAVPELSVEPVRQWLKTRSHSSSGKLEVLENLRFDPREEACDPAYAKELAAMGDIYVNEAFGSYHPAVSTTILPTILPHAAGLRFIREIGVLGEVRDNPKKPCIVIMGGAKVKDKLPVIEVLARSADAVLVGGKLISEIREQNLTLPANVLIGKLSEDGFDIAQETTASWKHLIDQAAQIIWNGPVGKIENGQWTTDNLGSTRGTYELAKMILESKAESIVGGGDTVGFLGRVGLLEKFEQKGLPAGRQGFVSVGGGAMLKFLAEGTLPTIQALNSEYR